MHNYICLYIIIYFYINNFFLGKYSNADSKLKSLSFARARARARVCVCVCVNKIT